MAWRCVMVFRVTLLVGVAVITVWTVWPRGPSCRGRTLSQRLKGFTSSSEAERVQAAQAVREMGPKAVPFLIARLRDPARPWTANLKWQLAVLEVRHLKRPLRVEIGNSVAETRRFQVLAACDALGPMATNALPALASLFYGKPSEPRAALVMADVGPAAFPMFKQGLTNKDRLIRNSARAGLELLEHPSQNDDFRSHADFFDLRVLVLGGPESRDANSEARVK